MGRRTPCRPLREDPSRRRRLSASVGLARSVFLFVSSGWAGAPRHAVAFAAFGFLASNVLRLNLPSSEPAPASAAGASPSSAPSTDVVVRVTSWAKGWAILAEVATLAKG